MMMIIKSSKVTIFHDAGRSNRHQARVNQWEEKGVSNLNVRILQESASLNGDGQAEDLTQLR